MKIITKIIRWCSIGCYVLIGGLAVLLLPLLAGKRPMIVLSGSMSPTFETGSLVYMEQITYGEIQVGDIISYGDGEIVSHRVVEKNDLKRTVTTKGDANETADGEIPESKILGRIREGLYIPWAGYLLARMKSPLVVAACAVIIVMQMIMQHFLEKQTPAVSGVK